MVFSKIKELTCLMAEGSLQPVETHGKLEQLSVTGGAGLLLLTATPPKGSSG